MLQQICHGLFNATLNYNKNTIWIDFNFLCEHLEWWNCEREFVDVTSLYSSKDAYFGASGMLSDEVFYFLSKLGRSHG